jgi:chromate transport protein ChrA
MTLLMWEQYKKTARYMQALILLACVAIYFTTWQWMAVLVFFVMMQVSAFLGAAWGARIKERANKAARRRGDTLDRRL